MTNAQAAQADLQTQSDAYQADAAQAADALAALQTEYAAAQAAAQTAADALAQTQDTLAATQDTLTASEQTVAQLSMPTDTNGAGNVTNGNLAVYYEGNIYFQDNYNMGSIYMENAAGYDDAYIRRTYSGGVSYVRNIAAIQNDTLYYINNNRPQPP